MAARRTTGCPEVSLATISALEESRFIRDPGAVRAESAVSVGDYNL